MQSKRQIFTANIRQLSPEKIDKLCKSSSKKFKKYASARLAGPIVGLEPGRAWKKVSSLAGFELEPRLDYITRKNRPVKCRFFKCKVKLK